SRVPGSSDAVARPWRLLGPQSDGHARSGHGSRVSRKPTNGHRVFLREGTRRLRALLEHRPAELLIAANGLPVGTLQVRRAESDLDIVVNLDEPIDFIEVFSEQHVRLLLFEVEPASRGGVEQAAHVVFDEDRSIDVRVSFAHAWPTVHLAYHDAAFAC